MEASPKEPESFANRVVRWWKMDNFLGKVQRMVLPIVAILFFGYLALLLVTAQSWGDAPAVVVESGSMMHCANGDFASGDACPSDSFGRIGTIDPGDLVLVRDANKFDDVETLAQGGNERYGKSGDVIVYLRDGATPIIHRAMFFLEIHENGTYSVPSLGLQYVDSLNQEVLKDEARFGLGGPCVITLSPSLGPEDSGFITKGDNNPCWDQYGGHGFQLMDHPIKESELAGKARGELPWIGLLKLFLTDRPNYAAAPADLTRAMWVSVGAILFGPWVLEQIWGKLRPILSKSKKE